METLTAKTICDESGISEDDKKELNKKILLCYHLSVLQNNLFSEIEQTLIEKAGYRLQIKHWHKQISCLLKKGLNLSPFWMKANQGQIDAFCKDADTLEKIVRKWMINN